MLASRPHLTFKGNLGQSRYGWLRLTPAYSLHLVSELLDRSAPPGAVVFDPYCGTGTTALACAERGLSSFTCDINPFLTWLARSKAARYSDLEIVRFSDEAARIAAAIAGESDGGEWLPDLHQIEKWWDRDTLHALGRAMAAIRASDSELQERSRDLLLLAFCRTLIERANVSFGHQSMSFKKRRQDELALGAEQQRALVDGAWERAVEELARSAASPIERTPEVLLCDARSLGDLRDRLGPTALDCVITSPPYPNRMSYIRELRPYMYWLGYLADGRAAGALDWQAIGGTWGIATSNVGRWEPPSTRPVPHADFDAILARIATHSDLLSRYVHKYFYDIVDHVAALSGLLAPAARLHYIVGNSKFYDVMLPVQEIYAAIFERAGLGEVEIETIRKRSSKRELFEYVVSARQPA